MKILLLAAALFVLPNVALAAVTTPTNLTIYPSQYTNDTTPSFSWSPVYGATWYDFDLDGRGYSGIGNVTSYTLPVQSNGWHTFMVRAHDNNGSISAHTSVTFEIDTVGPSVSAVPFSSVVGNSSTNVVITASGEAAVTGCWLMVNNTIVETMSNNGSTWSATYAFPTSSAKSNGTIDVAVKCTDGDNNWTTGANQVVTFSSEVTTQAVAGDRIKTACSSYASVNDACHAVYYYGTDGKRHAFPGSDVYYTWYNNFDGVKTVSSSFMANLALGKNVTFHPGSVLVKFASSNDIYAISRGGVLHRYLNDSLVAADYGSNWNWYLRTVPDYYRSSYSAGSVIDQTSDYDAATARASVSSIDGNL